MQSEPKLIFDKKKKKSSVVKSWTQKSKALIKGDTLNDYLNFNGVKTSHVEAFHKIWKDNWLRCSLIFICHWLFVSLLLWASSHFSDKPLPFLIASLLASPANILLLMCPEMLLLGESFVYKWKAKKLKKLFLDFYSIDISKKSIRNNELGLYNNLKNMFVELGNKYKIADLYGAKSEEVWKDWDVKLEKVPGNWFRFAVYANNNYAGKDFTERSINDIASALSGGADFTHRLDALMMNRVVKSSELHRLVEEFFFLALLGEELQQEYEYLQYLQKKQDMSQGMTIVI